MADNKYVIQDDYEIGKAGFQNLSYYDKERNKILAEMDKYSWKSFSKNPDGISTVYISLILGTLICGLHRLTNGKILSGLLFAVTLGGCFVWMLIDWFTILSGKFTDKDKKPINVKEGYRLQQALKELDQRHARGEL